MDIFTLLALLALAVQCFAVDTHIHGRAPAPHASALSLVLQQHDAKAIVARWRAPPRGQLPPTDDSANCPFCQDLLAGGHFLAPIPPITVGGSIFPALLVPQVARLLTHVTAPSHIWRGRAPPRA